MFLRLVAAALAVVFFAACSDEDEGLARDASAAIDLGAAPDASDAGSRDALDPIDSGEHPDAIVIDLGVSPTFTAVGVRDFVTDEETLRTPIDYSADTLQLFAPDQTELAVTGASGMITAENVPPGPLTLVRLTRRSATIIVTEERNIDLGGADLGRPTSGRTPRGTALALRGEGMEPWQEGDTVALFSSNPGVMISDLSPWIVSAPPPRGATELTGLLINYRFPLIEAAEGDRALFAQMKIRRATGSVPYRALSRVLQPEPFDVKPSESSSVSGTFVETAQRILRVDWPIAQIDAMQIWTPKRAVQYAPSLRISTIPLLAEHGVYDTGADLAYVAPSLRARSMTATIGYGNPFAGNWREHYIVEHFIGVPYTARGALEGYEVPATIFGYAPIDDSGNLNLSVPLGPVTSVFIEGVSAFEPQIGVGPRPRITWSPPEIGTPSGYLIGIYALVNFNGQTFPFNIVLGATDLAEFTVPPGILEPDSEYIFSITSVWNGRQKLTTAPFRYGESYYSVEVLSAVYIP